MDDDNITLVERLYDAFNHRDVEEITDLCDEEMEFFPTVTAEAFGRADPYVGLEGLHRYLADIARFWEELQITPCNVQRRGDRLLVTGRVYARSRDLGIRDVPVAWIWQLRDGKFARGEVFPDPVLAVERFAAVPA